MRRAIALGLSVLMCTALFSGCSRETEEGGKKVTLPDDVKFAASGTAWEIQGMDFGLFDLEAGNVEIKLVFDVVGAEYKGVFLDYLEITVE